MVLLLSVKWFIWHCNGFNKDLMGRFGYTQLMQAAHRVLSPVNQSIFFGNLKRIANGYRHLVFTETSLRAPLCGLQLVRTQCKRSLRSIIAFWRRKRILIGIRLQFVTSRAPTMLSVLDSTTKWGYRDRNQFV